MLDIVHIIEGLYWMVPFSNSIQLSNCNPLVSPSKAILLFAVCYSSKSSMFYLSVFGTSMAWISTHHLPTASRTLRH